MKKWHEILITFGIILVLLLLSFAFLKLPKLYFEHSDEKLNGVVRVGAYDIDNEIKSMSMAQILDVFEKEDILMVEEEAPVLDNELFNQLIAGTLREFLMMIFDEKHEDYAYMLTIYKNGVLYCGSAYTILEVENDEIYSTRVGAMYWETALMYEFESSCRVEIVFNLDTYDILAVYLGAESFYGEGFWDFWIALKDYKVLEEQLNQYYGKELSWENFWNGGVVDHYLTVVPWGYEAEEKRILRTLRSRLNEGCNEYVDFTEMLQE